jgi:hypothetical protein
MAGEAETPVTDDTPEHEERDADFDAGFSGTSETSTETPTPTPAPTPAPTPVPTSAPAPEFVQVTREDWDRVSKNAAKVDEIEATFGKLRDQAFGKIGGLERAFAQIQQATPQGAAVEISAEDFTELKEQYPELAELTLKGLNKAMGKLKGTGGTNVDPKVFDEKFGAIRDEVTDMTLDAIVDGDWQALVKKPEDGSEWQYGNWVATQKPEIQKLAASDKLRDAARLMRLFKAHLDTPAPVPTPAPSPAPTPAPTPSPRQQRTTAAVPPRGDGGHPPAPSEEDEFSAGFNYRRSG